jgi:hypothetical protein
LIYVLGAEQRLADSTIENQKSKFKNVLAGLTRLELAISASTVQRFDPTKLQPREYCRFLIADCRLVLVIKSH